MRGTLIAVLLIVAALLARPAIALDRAAVDKLALGDGEEKIEAIAALVAEGDPKSLMVLGALLEGELQVAGKRVLIVKGANATDAITGESVTPVPSEREDIIVNNRLRGTLNGALAALKLVSDDRAIRLAAVKELAGS